MNHTFRYSIILPYLLLNLWKYRFNRKETDESYKSALREICKDVDALNKDEVHFKSQLEKIQYYQVNNFKFKLFHLYFGLTSSPHPVSNQKS